LSLGSVNSISANSSGAVGSIILGRGFMKCSIKVDLISSAILTTLA